MIQTEDRAEAISEEVPVLVGHYPNVEVLLRTEAGGLVKWTVPAVQSVSGRIVFFAGGPHIYASSPVIVTNIDVKYGDGTFGRFYIIE